MLAELFLQDLKELIRLVYTWISIMVIAYEEKAFKVFKNDTKRFQNIETQILIIQIFFLTFFL